MPAVFRAFAIVAAFLAIAFPSPSIAQTAAPVDLGGGVRYELIGRWDADKLNQVLTVDTPKFFDIDVKYTPARNAVKLYRVTYPSVVPEKGNLPIIASGLVAVPDTGETSFPMFSYQHGTVYLREQVPSFPDQSAETALALAQFAGQGYVLIGADYFGMGISKEPEGYMVKGSHQQATYDMLLAARAVLANLKITTTKLFLGGWSQGGFVTMVMVEKLEQAGIKVDAAATASAPVDLFALLNGTMNFPRSFDAAWMPTIFMLASFSYENYYGVPGLARSLINDEYYEISRKLYTREPLNAADVPTDLKKLIRKEYFDTQFFAASAFGRLMHDADAYRWVIKSPIRNYYGETDEAITVGVGRMAMTYQQAIGAGNMVVEAVSTGKTTHRGTYATAVPQWKLWFDSLAK